MINNKVPDHNVRKQPRPRSREEQRLARDQIVIVIDKIIIEETVTPIVILREKISKHDKLKYIILDKQLCVDFYTTHQRDEIKSYVRKMKESLNSESGRNR